MFVDLARAARGATLMAVVGALTCTAVADQTQNSQSIANRVNEAFGLRTSALVDLPLDTTLEVTKEIRIALGAETYTLDLAPHSVRDPLYQVYTIGADGIRVPAAAAPVNTFRGFVRHMPQSRVSAGIVEGGLMGRIDLGNGEEPYWIEPVAHMVRDAGATMHVVYQARDVLDTGGTCGVTEVDQLANATLENDPKQLIAFGASGSCTTQLGVDADYEYFDFWSNNVTSVQNRINSVINSMNQQYEDEVLISHAIVAILVRTSPGAPYTSTNPGVLLNQFQNEWNANQGSIQRDVAHLFTGKSLDGTTIGIAATGTVCFTSLAYSLVENLTNFGCATDLSAHELGHNWNALHCSCSTFTMNPSLTCANRFSGATIATITNFRNSRTCLECQPSTEYCTAGATLNFNRYVTRLTIADIDNSSSGSGYSDFTSVTTELVRGSTYTVDVEVGGINSSATVGGLWIDRTGDNDFEDAFETIADEGDFNGVAPYSTSFTVTGYPLGPTRLRVRVQDGSQAPIALACGTTQRGEVEDYTVIVVDPPMGACCFPEGCFQGDETGCGAGGGTFLGVGVLCSECVLACPTDIDGDGSTAFTDLTALLAAWGPCGICPEDIDNDNSVAFSDLTLLLANWGPCPE